MSSFTFSRTATTTILTQSLSLLSLLKEIAENVIIKDNFSIHHLNYKPFTLPEDFVIRLQKMPEQMKHKYLSLHLRSFLYGIYYNGSMQTSLAPESEDNHLYLDLENNTMLGVDVDFYEQLNQNNLGIGYYELGWQVLRKEEEFWVVTKNHLRLYIDPKKHLLPAKVLPIMGEKVSILMPKNRVQSGFYMAVGNQGFHHVNENLTPEDLTTVRVYFNLTPEGAVKIMKTLTQQLNYLKIPFSFKVLYNPKDYDRYDSGVLYFDKIDYQAVKPILQSIYQEYQASFKPDIPLFTLRLASGLGLAEEPNQKFAKVESFGMNRCQIIANGLLEAGLQNITSSEERLKAIINQFHQLNINLEKVHLNAHSVDIYTPFC